MKLSLCFAAVSCAWAAAQATTNDECISATRIAQVFPFVSIVNTSLASNNPNDPVMSCSEGLTEGNTVWYVFTPPTDGVLHLEASGTLTTPTPFGDPYLFVALSIFTGSCNRLRGVACQKHFYGVLNQVVKAGQKYFVKVGEGFNGDLDGDGGGIMNFTASFASNYFNISNAETDQPIGLLQDMFLGEVFTPPGVVDYLYSKTSSLSVEAIFNPSPSASPIKSVRLTLDNPPISRCENGPPFTLFGNAGSNLYGAPFVLGNRVVNATPYPRSGCSGSAGKMVSQKFEVRGCYHLHYSLYDARKNMYISSLYNASTVVSPPCQANIGVEFTCGFNASSVRLELREASSNRLVRSRNETSAPYFLFGDNGRGDINSGRIPAGEYTITAIIDSIIHPSVRFTYGVCNPTPIVDNNFNIDLRISDEALLTFTDRFLYDDTKLFATAADRISSVVMGDRPDVLNTTDLGNTLFCGAYPPVVDDLFVCASLYDYLDGTGGILGFVLGSYARESDGLPFTGTVVFDTSDYYALMATGEAGFFVLQQLIRVLGLGLSWKDFGLAERSAPCAYNGTKANMEFERITGCPSVPLEQSGGTEPLSSDEFDNCVFWDQECLKEEILTLSTGKKKISRITLGALEDLGYVVNYTAADPYGISDIGTCAGCGGSRRTNAEENKTPISSCHSGGIYEQAIHHGRKIINQANEHHENRVKQQLPQGIKYIGNRQISVAYIHEDGTLCSAIVTP